MIYWLAISVLVGAAALTVYIYYDDGSAEHERNSIIIFLALSGYLLVGTTMIVCSSGIKSLVTKITNFRITRPASTESKPSYINSYVEGYLLKGAPWRDTNGNIRYSSGDTLVEIWEAKIVTVNGGELTQIFFLEGVYAGVWGYTHERFLLRDVKPRR